MEKKKSSGETPSPKRPLFPALIENLRGNSVRHSRASHLFCKSKEKKVFSGIFGAQRNMFYFRCNLA